MQLDIWLSEDQKLEKMVEANVPPFSNHDERETTQAFIDKINEAMR